MLYEVITLAMLSIVTAAASALLDNVTTVLLVVPVTLVISEALRINPYPFLFSQILAANIGGTATLVGAHDEAAVGGEERGEAREGPLDGVHVGEDVGVVHLEVVDRRDARSVVEELGAPIPERNNFV